MQQLTRHLELLCQTIDVLQVGHGLGHLALERRAPGQDGGDGGGELRARWRGPVGGAHQLVQAGLAAAKVRQAAGGAGVLGMRAAHTRRWGRLVQAAVHRHVAQEAAAERLMLLAGAPVALACRH